MTTEQRDKLGQVRQLLGAAKHHGTHANKRGCLTMLAVADETIGALLDCDEPNADDYACLHAYCESQEQPEDFALPF